MSTHPVQGREFVTKSFLKVQTKLDELGTDLAIQRQHPDVG